MIVRIPHDFRFAFMVLSGFLIGESHLQSDILQVL